MSIILKVLQDTFFKLSTEQMRWTLWFQECTLRKYIKKSNLGGETEGGSPVLLVLPILMQGAIVLDGLTVSNS